MLALARKEAERFHHNFVGTEHLLLGLIALGQGTAVTVLTRLGLNLDTVRVEVEKQVGTGPDQKIIGGVPYTPRVKKVLAFAVREAKALNHTYVGTEHILLGLLSEPDGVAPRIFKNFAVDTHQTRQDILKELAPQQSPQEQQAERVEGQQSSASGAPERPHDQAYKSYEPMNNFTPRAQMVLALARQEADRLHHNFVGTEHLLLGIIKLGQGTAVTVLLKLEINLEALRAEVEKQSGAGPDQKTVGNIPYTPRVKRVLALAAQEARGLNHQYVGTEHMLLGLLHEGDGVAARVLLQFGVQLEKTRQEILKELDPNFTASQEPPGRSEEVGLQTAQTPQRESVDLSKRYDVYCREGNAEVVHRNVRFKGAKSLFTRSPGGLLSDFLELEHPDGRSVFVARSSVFKFCEHNEPPGSENVQGSSGGPSTV